MQGTIEIQGIYGVGYSAGANKGKLENSLNGNTPVVMLNANAVTGIREQF